MELYNTDRMAKIAPNNVTVMELTNTEFIAEAKKMCIVYLKFKSEKHILYKIAKICKIAENS